MKHDLVHKTEKLGRHVPGFLGYNAINYRETDLLLCRHLAREVEKVRDRLADFIAAAGAAEGAREPLGVILRATARLKEEVARGQLPGKLAEEIQAADEERLVDFDLALLDKIVALHTPLDIMETAGSPAEIGQAIDLYREGLAELRELLGARRGVLVGDAPSPGGD